MKDEIKKLARSGFLPVLEQVAKQVLAIEPLKYEGNLGKLAYEAGKQAGRQEALEEFISHINDIANE